MLMLSSYCILFRESISFPCISMILSISRTLFKISRSSVPVFVKITFPATGSILFTDPVMVSYRPPALFSSGTKTVKVSSGCLPTRSASEIRESF